MWKVIATGAKTCAVYVYEIDMSLHTRPSLVFQKALREHNLRRQAPRGNRLEPLNEEKEFYVVRWFIPAVGPHIPKDLRLDEYQLIKLVARGYSNAQMAEMLGVRMAQMAGRLRGVFRRCGVDTRTQLTALACRSGLPVLEGPDFVSWEN